MSSMSKSALALWGTDNLEKKKLMRDGRQPETFVGSEFMGLNTGFLPKLFGFQKFIKTFYLKDTLTFGNNFRVKQNNPESEYVKLFKDYQPVPQGHFLVVSAKDRDKWNHYSDAVFLDYGIINNAWYQPARLLRDYLVQPFPENPGILLGHAYFAVGPFQISGAFFVLERIK